ncbi:hypothetical protein F070042J6_02150 [Bacteroides sp. f07]
MYSYRKIARLLQENILYMWLSGKSTPDFRSINDFRSKRLKSCIHSLFTQIVLMLVELGYISLEKAARSLITFVEQIEIHLIMNRTTIEDAIFPDCPIRNILARISDKWSLLVIYTLDRSEKESVRFKELQRQISDISQKMLTVMLRTLEEDGYVTRTIYPEVPPRVEYTLTERTKSLLPHINSLLGWALENREPIMQDRKKAAGNS